MRNSKAKKIRKTMGEFVYLEPKNKDYVGLAYRRAKKVYSRLTPQEKRTPGLIGYLCEHSLKSAKVSRRGAPKMIRMSPDEFDAFKEKWYNARLETNEDK